MANLCHTRLRGLGSNGAGQLGVGHQQDLNEPQICQFALEFSQPDHAHDKVDVTDYIPENNTLAKLVAGGNHTILLTQQGRVYAAGNNIDGRCVTTRTTSTLNVFTSSTWNLGRVITDVAATWEATFLVVDARQIWVCGSGARGELGLGEAVTQCVAPCLVLDAVDYGKENFGVDSDRIAGISASMGHVVVLFSSGNICGWGSCRRGQIGQVATTSKIMWRPQIINISFRITHVVTGRDFTLVWNPKYEHVLLSNGVLAQHAAQLKLDRSQLLCVAGWSTIYTLHGGSVSGYGKGHRGQLPPTNLPPVTALAAGSEHCVALLADKKVIAWGWGEHGNCGSPVDNRGNVAGKFNEVTVKISDAEVPAGVGAGCASSFVWTVKYK